MKDTDPHDVIQLCRVDLAALTPIVDKESKSKK